MPLTFDSPYPQRYLKHEVEWYWRKQICNEIKYKLENQGNKELIESVIHIIMKRDEIDGTEE